MKVLHYNPSALRYEIPPSDMEIKGVLIQDINTIQQALGKGPIDEQQFEQLMAMNVAQLSEIAADQSSTLDRVRNSKL